MKYIQLIFAFTIISIATLHAQMVNVPIQLTQSVCSNVSQAKTATVQIGMVCSDVKFQEQIVIRQGTPVTFNVEIKKKKGCGIPATVTVTPVSTFDINNNIVPLTGIPYSQEGENKVGKSVGLAAGLGLTILFPFGIFFLCMKGGDACINGGTMVTATGSIQM